MLVAGDVVRIPQGTPHSTDNTGRRPLRLVSQVRRSGRRSGAGSSPWAEPAATAEEERSPAAGAMKIARVTQASTTSMAVRSP